MLWKSVGIFFLINTLSLFSEAIHVSEYNETNLFISMSSQLSSLRAELEHQGNFMDGLVKAMDLQQLKAEQERQGNLISGLVKESSRMEVDCQNKNKVDKESSVNVLRVEVERLGKLMDDLVKDRPEKLEDGLVNSTDIQFLREELERLKKDAADKESDIKSLRAELELQKKYRLEKELDFQSLRSEIHTLRVELGGQTKEGVDKQLDKYNISSKTNNCTKASQPFNVTCDTESRGGGWTVILRRMDGSVEFNRNWTEYKTGFGDLNGEFFLGLDKIHQLTSKGDQELLVLLEDFEGDERFETYEEFGIGNEGQQYILHTLGKANGTAGDSFSEHKGSKFSTFDRDNDPISLNCAKQWTAGWWYNIKCFACKLTGKYKDNSFGNGIIWYDFRNHTYSLKRAVMMIRPKK